MTCVICKKSKDVFSCDRCKGKHCEKCLESAGMSATEIRVLLLKSRKLMFICPGCTIKKVEEDQTVYATRALVAEEMANIQEKNELFLEKKFKKLEGKIAVVTEIEEKYEEVVKRLQSRLFKNIEQEISRVLETKLDCLSNLTDSLEEVKKEVSAIKTEVGGSKQVIEGKSYADKLKTRDSQTLVIRPKNKNNQDGTKTKKEVKTVVDPCELGIGIKGLKGIRDGGIAVSCENDDDRQLLKNEVEKKLGEQYEVKEVSKWKPKLQVIGIEEDLSKEDLKECIVKQNSYINSDCDLDVKVIRKWRTGFMAILEVGANIFENILNHGKLKIGWNVCKVFECLDVLRCYKCLGFRHKSADCRNVKGDIQLCAACGGENHRERDCKSKEMKCINCVRANEKLNLKLDTKHKAYDKGCMVLIRELEKKRERIDYTK